MLRLSLSGLREREDSKNENIHRLPTLMTLRDVKVCVCVRSHVKWVRPYRTETLGDTPALKLWDSASLVPLRKRVYDILPPALVQCCFTSAETVRTVWDREPRTSTSFFTQLLNSRLRQFNAALRPQRPSGLLGTGSPGHPPDFSHSS